MAEAKERRKTPRKATSKPDTGAPRQATSQQHAAPMATRVRASVSSEETRRLIAEAAYYRAKQRNFAPGRELEDWVQAESEVMGRINGTPD